MPNLAHPEGLAGFKGGRAARDPDVLQTPVVETFQFVARPNIMPPVRELLLDIDPAQAAVGLNCQVLQADCVHGTLHPSVTNLECGVEI